jgi:hypothetical protein
MAKPSLRLIHAANSPEELLFRANAHLSKGALKKALQLYTKVLYETSPGHICAFLNRALAYMRLGYPALAVVDAYRAGIAANEMRSINVDIRDPELKRVAATRLARIGKYFRTEILHVNGSASWTLPEVSKIGKGWETLPLASIVINNGEAKINTNDRAELCHALEMRAIFRMSAALMYCGGGAISDGLGLISDALMRCDPTSVEISCFNTLGGEAMKCIEYIMEEEEVRRKKSLGKMTGGDDIASTSQPPLKELMKTKLTMVRREVYPWKKLGASPSVTDELGEMVRQHTSKLVVPCTTRPTQEGLTPAVELRARRDIYPGEEMLSETNCWHVTTSISKVVCQCQVSHEVTEKSIYYCSTCAAALKPASTDHNASCSLFPAVSTLSASDSTNSSPENDTTSATSATSATSSPPPSLPSTASPHYGLASPLSPAEETPRFNQEFFEKRGAPILHCSPVCRELAEPFAEMCLRTNIQRKICESFPKHTEDPLANVHPLHPRSLYNHPKAQCIYDLLLVRTLITALNTNTNPLCLPSTKTWNGAFNIPQPKDHAHDFGNARRSLPWSFTANVVRPIQYLNQLFQFSSKGPRDPFEYLEMCDGWVLNTLLAKIMQETRIATGPVLEKVLDGDEMGAWLRSVRTNYQSSAGSAMSTNNESDGSDSKDACENVWVGSIHPLFNMIRVADASIGEKANVIVKEAEGITCVATGFAREGESCIKAGEVILRPADDLAGWKEHLLEGQSTTRGSGLNNNSPEESSGPRPGNSDFSTSQQQQSQQKLKTDSIIKPTHISHITHSRLDLLNDTSSKGNPVSGDASNHRQHQDVAANTMKDGDQAAELHGKEMEVDGHEAGSEMEVDVNEVGYESEMGIEMERM